jgi:hypothetical protein
MLTLDWPYVVIIVVALVLLALWILNLKPTPVDSPSLTEKQLQGKHFRQLQWHGFWSANLYFGLGLASVGALIFFLPPEKYNLIREIIGAVVAIIINEWKDSNKFIREAGASSARKIEYGNTNPVGEKEGQ